MKSICVFCGSSKGSDSVYANSAYEVGKVLATEKIQLVYGAGNIGLMGLIADAALEHGGEVLGIIPDFLKQKEVCHTGLTELIVTKTMHERKWIMEERSDGIIMMPGGFGTLDEFFEILTWKQLHLHQKPVGILNVNGYFDTLLTFIQQMVDKGFVRPSNLSLFVTADNIQELLKNMRTPANQMEDKWL